MTKTKVEWKININQIGEATVSCAFDLSEVARDKASWTVNYSGKPLPLPGHVAALLIGYNPDNIIE